MKHYLDTSALVKLVIAEDSSEALGEALDASDVLHTCRIAYPEARAAIAAAARALRLTRSDRDLARSTLDSTIWPELSVIEVTPGLATTAGDLAERLALRAFDALHLAAALEVASDDLILATWDARLWEAARAVGMRVTPAELPGA